jgi:hypothetical protein
MKNEQKLRQFFIFVFINLNKKFFFFLATIKMNSIQLSLYKKALSLKRINFN